MNGQPPQRLDKLPKGCKLVKLPKQPIPPYRKHLTGGCRSRSMEGGFKPMVEGASTSFSIMR